MSKLDRIYTFVTVAENNGFAAAAEKLGISAITVSRQMNALEEELGLKLITRSTRGIQVTEIGLRYYNEAKRMIEQFKVTESLIAQAQTEPSGKLTVMMNRYYLNNLVIPNLKEFIKLYPKVTVNIVFSERFPDFHDDAIDLMFGTIATGPEELVRRQYSATRIIVCASPQYLKENGTPQSVHELSKHQVVAHSVSPISNCYAFSEMENIVINPVMFVNDIETHVQCALNHVGIIKVIEKRVEQYLKTGQLVEILKEYAQDFPIYLYYRQNRYVDQKVRKFIDFFLGKLNEKK